MDIPSSEITEQIARLTSSRQRYVLEMRLGINYDRTHTLQEIADRLEVSRERVRQIQNVALSILSNGELNSMLLISELSTSPKRTSDRGSNGSIIPTKNLVTSGTKTQQPSEYIIVNFAQPTKGFDPVDGSRFVADRHKVRADWARQDDQETIFMSEGKVICSWPTKIISKITWPSGIDIPITSQEFENRMEQIKANYPKAWSKWSYEEELKLTSLFQSGKKVSQIAETMGRAPGGIHSRLRKLKLIDELEEFSEDLSIASNIKLDTGSVYGLIRNLYQISISPNSSENVHKRLSEPGWFLMTDEFFYCFVCAKLRIIVMRKHWKNMGRVFHRWAITCLECDKTGESRDFNSDQIDFIHKKLENASPVEDFCPDCHLT